MDVDNWFSTQGWSAGTGYTSLRTGTVNAIGGYQYNGVPVIFNSGTDVYGNFRVIQSNSTLNDGIYLNYNSTGGAAAHLRFYANGTSQRGYADAGNGDLYWGNNLRVSTANTAGGGIFLADDGSIVDLNDGFASMRFSQGVRITNGLNLNDARITLGSNGNITATSLTGTGSRPVYADANGTLIPSSSASQYSTNTTAITNLTSGDGTLTTSNFAVVANEWLRIEAAIEIRNVSGSGNDRWRIILEVSTNGGSSFTEISRTITATPYNNHGTFNYYPYIDFFVVPSSGNFQARFRMQRFDSDDSWDFRNARILIAKF